MQFQIWDVELGRPADIMQLLEEPWAASLAGQAVTDCAISGRGRAVLISSEGQCAVSEAGRWKAVSAEGDWQIVFPEQLSEPLFRLPGLFWVALLLFIGEWLPQIVIAPWVNDLGFVILAVAKALEVIVLRPRGSVRGKNKRLLKQLLVG